MIIDEFYSGINSKEKEKNVIDKSSFYLRMVTQVQRNSGYFASRKLIINT